MKKIYVLFLFLSINLFYILLINAFALALQLEVDFSQEEIKNRSGSLVQLSIGDSVGVQLIRERWYGVIIENVGKDSKISNLYLFNYVRLPINVNGLSFVWIHIIYLFLLIIFLPIFKEEKNEKGGEFNGREKEILE